MSANWCMHLGWLSVVIYYCFSNEKKNFVLCRHQSGRRAPGIDRAGETSYWVKYSAFLIIMFLRTHKEIINIQSHVGCALFAMHYAPLFLSAGHYSICCRLCASIPVTRLPFSMQAARHKTQICSLIIRFHTTRAIWHAQYNAHCTYNVVGSYWAINWRKQRRQEWTWL